MKVIPPSKRDSFILFIFTFVFLCISVQSIQARQSDRPFSLDLNLGGGLIGSSDTNTAFQPELGFGYMPGRWGVGLNAGLYNFDSGFNADQYRSGFEQYTVLEQSDDRWKAFYVNAGPRFEQNLSRIVSMKLGLDLAMNYQKGPSQLVRFNDPTGEMENAGFDTDIVLADMNGSSDAGWSAAIRPQLQLEFKPGFSDRFSFNLKTGIQHHLSDREMTYSARDLSGVRPMENVYEMHFQFDNAPVVQRTEAAPKTNFFANAGIKIRFGKSLKGLHSEGVIHRDIASRAAPEGSGSGDCDDTDDCPRPDEMAADAQDYNAARSNKPTSTADIGDGDPDSDGDGIDDAVEATAEDRGPNSEFLHEANVMARLINPYGAIISAGTVTMSTGPENPLYQDRANDGDGDTGNESVYPLSVQQYHIQPTSSCVSLSTMQISSNSQQAMRSGAQNHNSSRSNRTSGIANPDLETGGNGADSDSTMAAAIDAQNHNSSRSNRTSGVANPDLDTGDTAGQGSSRAIPPAIHGIAVDDPTNLKPDTDQDGFPEIMKRASFSISKRSARTGRSQSPIYEEETTNGTSPLYQSEEGRAAGGGDLDGDGYGDAEGFHFELEIMAPGLGSAASENNSVERGSNPNAPPGSRVAPSQTKVIVMGMTNNGDTPPSEESTDATAELDLDSDADGIPDFQDPDSDGDGLLDGLENATFSISEAADNDILSVIVARGGDRGAGTRSGGDENPLAVDEMEWVESAVQEVSPPNDVYQWTYNLRSMNASGEIPANGTLTVLFTGGAWHFDVQLDPDDDGDGFGEMLQNSSFSISKRSVRTGRR